MAIKFIIGLVIALVISQLALTKLSPKLYFNNKRVHHAHIGLFYLFIVLPAFLIAWATNQINLPVMIALAGLALGVLIHDLICHLFNKFSKN